jgi:hypothetical protein
VQTFPDRPDHALDHDLASRRTTSWRPAGTFFRRKSVTRTSGKLTNLIRYSLGFVFLFPRHAHKAVKGNRVHDGLAKRRVCLSYRSIDLKYQLLRSQIHAIKKSASFVARNRMMAKPHNTLPET